MQLYFKSSYKPCRYSLIWLVKKSSAGFEAVTMVNQAHTWVLCRDGGFSQLCPWTGGWSGRGSEQSSGPPRNYNSRCSGKANAHLSTHEHEKEPDSGGLEILCSHITQSSHHSLSSYPRLITTTALPRFHENVSHVDRSDKIIEI